MHGQNRFERFQMADAPLVSTIIAVGLLPVAFLFLHAFLSGLRRWRFHRFTGTLAIVWDLSMSIGYMIYRSLGGRVEGSSIDLTSTILLYFIIHGLIALLVIILEFGVIITGLLQWRKKKTLAWHRRLAKPLFVIWWFAFITGEVFYLVMYMK